MSDITAETIVISAGDNAGGGGAWSGTVGELVDHIERHDRRRAWRVLDQLRAEGAFDEPTGGIGHPETRLADVMDRLSPWHIRDLLDDPNAQVSTALSVSGV